VAGDFPENLAPQGRLATRGLWVSQVCQGEDTLANGALQDGLGTMGFRASRARRARRARMARRVHLVFLASGVIRARLAATARLEGRDTKELMDSLERPVRLV